MNDLSSLMPNKEVLKNIKPRRINLSSDQNIIIHGCIKSGTTNIALDLSMQFKNTIYIDIDDSRLDIEIAKSQILKKYLERQLDLIIIDNYREDCGITLPKCKSILISKKEIAAPKNFKIKKIYPRNFEEFISFDESKKMDISALFSKFLREGPLFINAQNEFYLFKTKQEIFKNKMQANFPIFLEILNFQASNFNPFRLYQIIKNKGIKTSKDSVYKFYNSLKEEGIIYEIKNETDTKIYFCDFALTIALNGNFNLKLVYENLILHELLVGLNLLESDGASGTRNIIYNQNGFIIGEKLKIVPFLFNISKDFINAYTDRNIETIFVGLNQNDLQENIMFIGDFTLELDDILNKI